MQLMTWPLARLGSRFGLLFEPHKRRVMHSAMGRFLDQPLDLAVGVMHPDGTQRVLPFTQHGTPLYGCEQFERINSVTYRGYDEQLGLKFELNFHSVFYPQDEKLCIMPAIYVELRVTWSNKIRWLYKRKPGDTGPDSVKLFIRLHRPDTQINVADGRIDMTYDVPLIPHHERRGGGFVQFPVTLKPSDVPNIRVTERIQSINEGATPIESDGGKGLQLELPVTPEGAGTKWRLVWAAHTADPVMEVRGAKARFRYNHYWKDLDAVIKHAIATRDDNLAHSRRFEKLLEQAPLTQTRRHLITYGFQSFLSNTFWCDTDGMGQWFSNWEGSCLYHSTVDVEYNAALFYFACWPKLLAMTLDQWTYYGKPHAPSNGVIMSHDVGAGFKANGQAYPHDMPVEENADFILLLHAYVHWTGDKKPLTDHVEFVRKLAEYLIWTDRDNSGFPSEGAANTIDDASPAIQYSRKQTYLAVKRVAALHAAGDLLSRADDESAATRCRDTARTAVPKIEQEAWLGDHYAVCIDRDASGMVDVWTGKQLPMAELKGWDDYSIYTANGLLFAQMVGKAIPFDRDKLRADLTSGLRETLTPYGCAHSSSDTANVWISQNIWRDITGRYLGALVPPLDDRYWDLQTYSNTADLSFGFIDTYVGNELCFYPRGAVGFGHFLAGPRITIDRLHDRGPRITLRPDRYRYSRWPLLPLADWKAGRIPVCVVDGDGRVVIEGQLESVEILNIADDPAA